MRLGMPGATQAQGDWGNVMHAARASSSRCPLCFGVEQAGAVQAVAPSGRRVGIQPREHVPRLASVSQRCSAAVQRHGIALDTGRAAARGPRLRAARRARGIKHRLQRRRTRRPDAPRRPVAAAAAVVRDRQVAEQRGVRPARRAPRRSTPASAASTPRTRLRRAPRPAAPSAPSTPPASRPPPSVRPPLDDVGLQSGERAGHDAAQHRGLAFAHRLRTA